MWIIWMHVILAKIYSFHFNVLPVSYLSWKMGLAEFIITILILMLSSCAAQHHSLLLLCQIFIESDELWLV